MSRIGKKPIIVPEGVTVKVEGSAVFVKGPKGELRREVHPEIKVEMKDGGVVLTPAAFGKKTSALWGLWRSLIANMVKGAAGGFKKTLEFEGVGYRAGVEADGTLVMQLGFSHPVRFPVPAGIKIAAEKNTIVVSGADAELVGNTAARIRALKPPEPYKGKGVRYQGEVIRRKAGKKAVAGA